MSLNFVMPVPAKTKKTLAMVLIPAGEFFMGSPVGQGDTDEYPPHPVYLEAFLIGRYLVTAAEWALFLNRAGPDTEQWFQPTAETTVINVTGRFHARRDCADHPANGATWFGAQAYCQWLSERTGRHYRLPTEAQWEKAARGGLEGLRYPWGNEEPQGRANFQQVWRDPRHTLRPVGSYPPNPYGLYDLVGNVWEWCSDWYDANYYRLSPRDNPRGPENGRFKVVRGGSWGGVDVQVRNGIRVGEFPEASDSRIGFRVARDAD